MEINSTLTTANVEQPPIFLPEDTSLSFWKGVWYAILFGIIQIAIMIPVMIAVFVGVGSDDEVAMNDYAMGIGLPIAFIGAAWFFYRKIGLPTTAFSWKATFPKLIILGTILLFCISYLIEEIITYLPGYEAMLADYLQMFEGISPMALLVGGVIVGPICEEIIFRGVILEGLSKKYSATMAIVFSALIFGLIHLQPLQIFGAFFAGLVLGWIYLKTQSLWVVIALHVVNNAFSFLLGDAAAESTRTLIGNDALYAGSFVAAALIAYLGYKGFQKVNEPKMTIETDGVV